MREIKFRAWDKLDSQMVHIETFQQIPSNWRDVWNLMQFTGLLDKNGKEIYEGDLVKNKWTRVDGADIGHIYQVKFGEYDNSDYEYGSGGHIGFYVEALKDQSKEGLHNLPTDDHSRLPEVIGNIHENPELLKP